MTGTWSPDGTVAVISDIYASNNTGLVHTYHANGDEWIDGGSINGTQIGETNGISVSLSSDGSIIAISSSNYNNYYSHPSGRVRVFHKPSAEWVQLGEDVYGTVNDTAYGGLSVSLSHDGFTLVAGSTTRPEKDKDLIVYKWNSTAWTQLGNTISMSFLQVQINTLTALLSANGTTLLVSTPYTGGVDGDGFISVFDYNSESELWQLRGDPVKMTHRSVSMSADGTMFAAGDHSYDNTSTNIGLAKVYSWDSTAWVQRGQDIVGSSEHESCGDSVSLLSNGSMVAVGCSFFTYNGYGETVPGFVRFYRWHEANETWLNEDAEVTEEEYSNVGKYVSLSSCGTRVIAGHPGTFIGVYELQYVNSTTTTTTTTATETTIETNTTTQTTTEPTTAPTTTTVVITTTEVPLPPNIARESRGMSGPEDEGSSGQRAGSAVAISQDGEIRVVGASVYSGQGRVLIFNTTGGQSSLVGTIAAPSGSQNFGNSVAISRDNRFIVAGHSTGVSVIERVESEWATTAVISPSPSYEDSDKGCTSVFVSDDGSNVLCGVSSFDTSVHELNSGAVFAFDKGNETNSTWSDMEVSIIGGNANDNVGRSFSVSDDWVIAVGAPRQDDFVETISRRDTQSAFGYVDVFQWNGTNLNRVGERLNGSANGDWFGYSVSLSSDGSVLAVGAPQYGSLSEGYRRGRVSVYEYRNDSWDLVQNIDGMSGGNSGWSVSLSDDGTYLAVGAPYASRDENSPLSGSFIIYERNGTEYIPLSDEVFGDSPNDLMGFSVSLADNGKIIVGEPTVSQSQESGGASVFSFSSSLATTTTPTEATTVSETTTTASNATTAPVTTQAPVSDSEDTTDILIIASAVTGGVVVTGVAVFFIVRWLRARTTSYVASPW